MALVALFIDHLLKNNRLKKAGILLFTVLFIGNLGAMVTYQKLFYNKKEVRRQILKDVMAQTPKLRLHSRICFIDLPIRDDEIKNMIYLWYKGDNYRISTINADNAACEQAYDPKIKYKYDYVFVYKCAEKKVKLVSGHD